MKSFIVCVNLMIVLLNVVDGYTVVQNQNGIFCDGVKCPENSANCIVSQKTRPDLTKIDYVRKCLDSQGNELYKFENTVNNPHPGSAMNSYVSTGGFSNTVTSRFGGDEVYNDKEARKQVEAAQKHVDEVLRNVQHQQEYWQQWSKDFNANLQKQLAQSLRY